MHEVSGISEIPEYERLFDESVLEQIRKWKLYMSAHQGPCDQKFCFVSLLIWK